VCTRRIWCDDLREPVPEESTSRTENKENERKKIGRERPNETIFAARDERNGRAARVARQRAEGVEKCNC